MDPRQHEQPSGRRDLFLVTMGTAKAGLASASERTHGNHGHVGELCGRRLI